MRNPSHERLNPNVGKAGIKGLTVSSGCYLLRGIRLISISHCESDDESWGLSLKGCLSLISLKYCGMFSNDAPLRHLLALCFFSAATPVFAVDWYVAPVGNDAWSGLLAEPNTAGTDGPFASLNRARDAVRIQLATDAAKPNVVNVRAGTYRLKAALELGEKDSGTASAPVVWRGYEKERPRVTGTLPLVDWEPAGLEGRPSALKIKLPEKQDLALCKQLLLRGKRLPIARYPNADESDPITKGWAFAGGKDWPMYADIPGEDKHTLQVRPADQRSWGHPEDAEVFVFARFNWWNDLVAVSAKDADTGVLTLAKDCSYPIRSGNRYFVQGPLEEMDAPGEWHLDPRTRTLFFLPPDHTRASDVELVVAAGLLKVKNGRHLSIENMDWDGTNGSAVVFENSDGCRFAGHMLRSVGYWAGTGVSVSGGKNVEVRSNTVVGAGRNAVSVSGGVRETLERCEHVVENNHLHDFGVYFKQGVGVSVSGVGSSVVRNWIHNGPRFGVMHGGNLNLIEGNHLHDLSLETEDTGAIYSGGRDWITPRGSVIRHNWIHDIWGMDLHDGKFITPHFSWGIYLDDNSGGVDVIGNLVERCGRGGVHMHAARDCVIENNIWVGNRQWQVDVHGWSVLDRYTRSLPAMIEGYEKVASNPEWKKMRGMEIHPRDVPLPNGLTMRGNRLTKNILVSTDPEVPVIDIKQVPFTHNEFDHNLYWAPGGKVRTGFLGGGPNLGDELLGAWKGAKDALPEGWRFSNKPSGGAKAGLSEPREDGLALRVYGGGKPYPVVSGGGLPLEFGAAYRLSARVRGSQDAKATVGVQSFLSGVYFWASPKSEVRVTQDWEEKEWVFVVPSEGRTGWHPKMAGFSPRIEWRSEDGWLEVGNLSLHRVEMRSEWESWRANGVDAHSLVADPLFEEGDPRRLSKDSPAWGLGFERIPFEKIGVYQDAWRSALAE